MKVYEYKVKVEENGDLIFKTRLPIRQSKEVKLYIVEAEPQENINVGEEELGFMRLAEESFNFWNNPEEDLYKEYARK